MIKSNTYQLIYYPEDSLDHCHCLISKNHPENQITKELKKEIERGQLPIIVHQTKKKQKDSGIKHIVLRAESFDAFINFHNEFIENRRKDLEELKKDEDGFLKVSLTFVDYNKDIQKSFLKEQDWFDFVEYCFKDNLL